MQKFLELRGINVTADEEFCDEYEYDCLTARQRDSRPYVPNYDCYKLQVKYKNA